MKYHTLRIALAAFFLTGTLHAQVPQIINYQGRVAVGTTNFNGQGRFKFALVSGAHNTSQTATATAVTDTFGGILRIDVTFGGSGYTSPPAVSFTGDGSGATVTATVANGQVTVITVTHRGIGYDNAVVSIAPPPQNLVSDSYWSNNGSSVNGSEPTNSVNVTVTNGLYSVLLGDTSPPLNMTAIPASVFTHPDVRLRVWFDDLVAGHGSQLLSPDQRIAAVGYAMSVSDGAITSAKIATGAVGSSQLAPNLIVGGSLASSGLLALPATASSSVGVLDLGGVPFLHAFGNANTFLGRNAGNFTMNGGGNTALGFQALFANMSGSQNTATGSNALRFNTTGSNNTASGNDALPYNTTGSYNTATGNFALYSNTTGFNNTASGYQALYSTKTAHDNTAFGNSALMSDTDGYDNTAVGSRALYSNLTGTYNTATGDSALYANTTGDYNTAYGLGALQNNLSGSRNIAIGYNAGIFADVGWYNIDIGNLGVTDDGATIRIGTAGVQNRAFIAGIYGATASGGVPVYVNSSGQLGTLTSSRRFKQDIASMDGASDALLSLRPVSFRYKTDIDPKGLPQFGLIAEEVDKVAPELVARDDKGEIYTVRYEAVNAMLLNEFLKDHRRLQTVETRLNEENGALKKRLAEVEAGNSDREAREKAREERLAKLERLIPSAATAHATTLALEGDALSTK